MAGRSSPPPEPLAQLRTQWKWAAFSQFFFTFNHLFPVDHISLNDIEADLVRGSSIVLPRVMQRLLYTLSYDRKISIDNWQTALRKQYRKRDPTANPIGPEPLSLSPKPRSSSPAPGVYDHPTEECVTGGVNTPGPSTHPDATDPDMDPPESTRASTLELDHGLSHGPSAKGLSAQPSEPDSLRASSAHLGDYPEEQEEVKDWLELPMLTKLDSMHLLAEWQFQNPMRLRTLMRSDNDDATWRIEPIGYDSKKNAYWVIGADRLWLQRPIPRPPRPSKSKPRAKPTPKSKPNARPSTSQSQSLKRKRGAGPPPPPSKYKYKRPRLQDSSSQITLDSASGTGRSRAAKAQANIKLDAQAKELAELNRQAAALARSPSGLRNSRPVASTSIAGHTPAGSPSAKGKERDQGRPMGTRISARLRGGVRYADDGEWQAVPQEWLIGDEEKMDNGKGKGKQDDGGWLHDVAVKTGLERQGSESSELTELSEESGCAVENDDDDDDGEDYEAYQEEQEELEQNEVKREEMPEETKPVDDRGLEDPPVLPEGFVEWETICVSLHEWEHIAERFAKATHYLERALYKVLVNDIVPDVTAELREIERRQHLSLAVTQRKRSSRLLLRQFEREEAEATARKLVEEEERHSRARRAEARHQKEEVDRERREIARQARRKEREEREELAKEGSSVDDDDAQVKSSTLKDTGEGDGMVSHGSHLTKPFYNGALPDSRYNHNGNGRLGTATPATGSGSRTPAGDDWELNCEVCHQQGINLDDGTPMMSCGHCSKWQHIACHDRADQQAGWKPRNWDVVEFFCLKCRGQIQSAMGIGAGQLPYLGHAYSDRSGVNLYMGPVGNQPAAPRTAIVNGSSRAHVGEHHNIPSPPTAGAGVQYHHHQQRQRHMHQHQPQHQPQSHPLQQHPYGATTNIAFSHYQPQQRGFSSSPLQQQEYNASGHTQPYGQHTMSSSSSQYGQFSTNGSRQSYQTSQTRWNVTTPAEHASPSPYNGVAPTTNMNGGGSGRFVHHNQPSSAASIPHTPAVQGQEPWQNPNHQVPLVDPTAGLRHQQQIPHLSQFRYHPA